MVMIVIVVVVMRVGVMYSICCGWVQDKENSSGGDGSSSCSTGGDGSSSGGCSGDGGRSQASTHNTLRSKKP